MLARICRIFLDTARRRRMQIPWLFVRVPFQITDWRSIGQAPRPVNTTDAGNQLSLAASAHQAFARNRNQFEQKSDDDLDQLASQIASIEAETFSNADLRACLATWRGSSCTTRAIGPPVADTRQVVQLPDHFILGGVHERDR